MTGTPAGSEARVVGIRKGDGHQRGQPQQGRPPGAPRHLSAAMKKLWRDVAGEYELESHHLKVLQAACEAFDRMTQARELVDGEGLLVQGRSGLVANPAVKIEHDARTQFYRGIRELDLDVEPPAGLPRLAGRR